MLPRKGKNITLILHLPFSILNFYAFLTIYVALFYNKCKKRTGGPYCAGTKDELRHKILLESEHLFLQRGYDRTSLQMIADKVNISSKSNLYHYFKNKEELFYELTDSAADGLKRMILRFRSMRFDLNMDAQEFRMLLTEGGTLAAAGGEIRPSSYHGAGQRHSI